MQLRLIVLLAAVPVVLVSHALCAAQARPVVKVKILQPRSGSTLTGSVEVRARFSTTEGARMPNQALAGLGGAPWVRLSRAQETNEWVGVIDTTLVPNGEQKLVVVTDERTGRGVVDVTLTNTLKCFFADLHSHTSYSDGTMAPEIAHGYARNTAKIDVFSLTDHLEKVSDEEWADMREQAARHNEDGKFVTLPGLEWTKKVGHACLYDPKTRVWPTELEAFYQAAADAGVIVKFNHPGTGTSVFNGLAYSETGDKAVQLMEVRRPDEEKAYIRALNQGWHLAPDGSSDTHGPNWGNVRTWTGLWAPGLSRRNVWEALMARRCFSTLDRNCQVQFTANGAAMGSILAEAVDTLKLAVMVQDPDPNDRVASITVFQDGQPVETAEPGTAAVEWSRTIKVQPGSHYWFVKVVQADGNTVWSAPIWAVGRPEE